MKTIVNPKVTVTDGKITICAEIKDLPFNGMLVTRVSHGHVNPDNRKHPRRIQSSNEAVFLESPAGKIAIPNSVIAAIATQAAPETSFVPVIENNASKPGTVNVVSETPYTVQWQVSNDAFPMATKPNTPPPSAVWTNLVGSTTEDFSNLDIKKGQWLRCVATNLTGTTISKPFKPEKK